MASFILVEFILPLLLLSKEVKNHINTTHKRAGSFVVLIDPGKYSGQCIYFRIENIEVNQVDGQSFNIPPKNARILNGGIFHVKALVSLNLE
jgi:hypothetical protein